MEECEKLYQNSWEVYSKMRELLRRREIQPEDAEETVLSHLGDLLEKEKYSNAYMRAQEAEELGILSREDVDMYKKILIFFDIESYETLMAKDTEITPLK